MLEYIRVANAIEAKINAADDDPGRLRPGAKLPSEHAIATEYEVAYSTARRAMKECRDRGLIITVWGKGTFVAQRE